MAWQSVSGLESSNSHGGGDVQPVSSQLHGTEYTLQGVMRFLQTEWHRHERDRNSWEIERQEMKGRIAKLEGSTRKSDAGSRALKKYVDILERALKERDKLIKELKTGKDVAESIRVKKENASKVAKEKHRSDKPQNLCLDTTDFGEIVDEDPDRGSLKSFLDKTQTEVTYLMVSSSNPPPPRQVKDEIQSQSSIAHTGHQVSEQNYHQQNPQRVVYSEFQRSSPISSQRSPPIPISVIVREKECTSPLSEEQPNSHTFKQDWSNYQSRESSSEERVKKTKHTPDQNSGKTAYGDEKRHSENNGWDFNEADAFPEAEIKVQESVDDSFSIPEDMPNSPNETSSNWRKDSVLRRKCSELDQLSKVKGCDFKVRYGLRGHLDVVRSVIFTGGGRPGEPEICTTGDDGTIKRWIIPARMEDAGNSKSDMDIESKFTHRGHTGSGLCLTSWPSQNFSGGGRAQGDGWVFSGGQDATIRVWERGRVGPKATLDGHTDAVWTICVLPGTTGSLMGQSTTSWGESSRILLASGSADGTVKMWSVTVPQQSLAERFANRRGSRVRGNSMSSGSGFPSSPQPSVVSSSPLHYTLIHSILRADITASPTCITTLSTSEAAFVVSYSDAAVLVYDTKTGEVVATMASLETYDKTKASGVNAIVASTSRVDAYSVNDSYHSLPEDEFTVSETICPANGIEGIIISGHEDRYIRFYDAISGQCTYSMLAHTAAIAALAISPDGRELVSAGHDASLRFWSLEKRSCTQEITSHRLMRGEGVCSVSWNRDGRWVVSAGGDGVVKVFAR